MSTGDVMATCPACGEMYYYVNGHCCKRLSSISTNELYAKTVDGPFELVLKRLKALEYEVAVMRGELAELRAGKDAEVVDYDDTELWIGGNDGPDD